ncbi:eppin isoform X1 [Erinaceus europaeus]|uniref:Eppin isoform X1 n=1 Tax=Erinaceus europaeus TaxID=9365 RepID=A0ABM3XD92_ERIEU|nr:eppin isoform X1 [Erinaceus europaeus]
MGLLELWPILGQVMLLVSVQEPWLVEGFFRRLCPRDRVKCEMAEWNQCTRSRHCPGKMRCCMFNCGKKCLDLREDICSLPKETGPCQAFFLRWWYDHEKEVCSEFIYGGCHGNNNNFQSEAICQALCQKKKVSPRHPTLQGCAKMSVCWLAHSRNFKSRAAELVQLGGKSSPQRE